MQDKPGRSLSGLPRPPVSSFPPCFCPSDLFEPRKDAPEDLPRREEAIYLYGVDIMSTKDCMQYFDDYGPTLVEWINDSSCKCHSTLHPTEGTLFIMATLLELALADRGCGSDTPTVCIHGHRVISAPDFSTFIIGPQQLALLGRLGYAPRDTE